MALVQASRKYRNKITIKNVYLVKKTKLSVQNIKIHYLHLLLPGHPTAPGKKKPPTKALEHKLKNHV
jgi:hypothetical protein